METDNTGSRVLHPIAIAQVMVNFGLSHGVDEQTCLEGTGVTDETLATPDALIRREQEMRLVENLLLALPDLPALGFELGLQYTIATFGSWGFLMRTSRTLHDAIRRTLTFLPLSTAYCDVQPVLTPEHFGVSFDARGIPRHLRQTMLERDMGTAIQLLREMGLTGIPLQALNFAHDRPDHAKRIEELSGITPSFNQPQHALLLRRQDAERPLPTYDEQLVQMLDAQCRQQLERRQCGGTIAQVRQQILGSLGLTASLEQVASALKLSPRSLRRRLEAEGTHFRELVEHERRQLSGDLLRNTKMTQEEIAIHLGYGDTSSFTRAFRRWFGESPGAYRQH